MDAGMRQQMRLRNRNGPALGHGRLSGPRRAAVLEALRIAFEMDLTARQRASLGSVFFDGERLADAAGRLGISVSAVSRHVKAGMKKLDRAASDAEKIVDAYEKRLAKEEDLC